MRTKWSKKQQKLIWKCKESRNNKHIGTLMKETKASRLEGTVSPSLLILTIAHWDRNWNTKLIPPQRRNHSWESMKEREQQHLRWQDEVVVSELQVVLAVCPGKGGGLGVSEEQNSFFSDLALLDMAYEPGFHASENSCHLWWCTSTCLSLRQAYRFQVQSL